MRNQKGQALTELGIVVVLLIMITLGAVEFGYTFLAANDDDSPLGDFIYTATVKVSAARR